MKAALLTLVILASSTFASARQPKATLFSAVAKGTIETMYGREGDIAKIELTQMDHGSAATTETWEVTLINNARNSLATYEVIISQNTVFGEGESDIAKIQINSVR